MLFPSVIQQSIAPAFLLGAVASFVSVLNQRSDRIIHHRNAISPGDREPRSIARRKMLTRRARLLYSALLLALISGAAAAALIVISFAYAFFKASEERGLALIFTVSLVFLGLALVQFAREVFLSRLELDD